MKTRLLMTISAAMLTLAGCTNEDQVETIDNWNGEIRLTSGVDDTDTCQYAGNADTGKRNCLRMGGQDFCYNGLYKSMDAYGRQQ